MSTGGFRNFAVSAAQVKELRGLTGSPLKDCMAALEENNGDIEASKDYLRKKGLAAAEKKMDRVAAEGLVGVLQDPAKQKITMIQLACETDFVAKTEKFQEGLKAIMHSLHHNSDAVVTGPASVDLDLLTKLQNDVKMVKSIDPDVGSQTIDDAIKYTIAKTQENVQLVKVFQTNWNAAEGDVLHTYIHQQTEKGSGIGKLGSLIHLSLEDKKPNPELQQMAQQLSMHIAAMKPTFIKKEDIPEEVQNEILESEKGQKALKQYIKRDVLWEQDLATAEKNESVGKFFSRMQKSMGSKITIENWALFMIQ